MTEEGV